MEMFISSNLPTTVAGHTRIICWACIPTKLLMRLSKFFNIGSQVLVEISIFLHV